MEGLEKTLVTKICTSFNETITKLLKSLSDCPMLSTQTKTAIGIASTGLSFIVKFSPASSMIIERMERDMLAFPDITPTKGIACMQKVIKAPTIDRKDVLNSMNEFKLINSVISNLPGCSIDIVSEIQLIPEPDQTSVLNLILDLLLLLQGFSQRGKLKKLLYPENTKEVFSSQNIDMKEVEDVCKQLTSGNMSPETEKAFKAVNVYYGEFVKQHGEPDSEEKMLALFEFIQKQR